jgi:hypothetical protein
MLSATLYILWCSLHIAFQYVVLYAGENKASFSVASVVGTALLVKLFVVATTFVYISAGDSWDSTRQSLFEARYTMLTCACPALLYALGDILKTVSQLHLTMSELQGLYAFRMPFVAFIYTWMFNKSLPKGNWIGLCVIFLGVISMELQKSAYDGGMMIATSSTFIFGLLALCGVLATAFGGGANEYLLKNAPGTISLQNTALYSWGLVPVLFFSALMPGPVGKFGAPQDQFEALAVVTLAAYGITAAYFLKYLGIIWREVGMGTVLFVDACIDVMRGEIMPTGTLMSLCLIFVGLLIFILAEYQQKKREDEEGK